MGNKGQNKCQFSKTQPRDKSFNEIIVQGSCRDRNVNFLLDSGATISLVATRLVHVIGLADQIRPTSKIVVGLAKSIVPMRGEIELKVRIGQHFRSHIFLVSDKIDNEFLIGLDLMKKFEMCLDIGNKVVSVLGDQVPFKHKPRSVPSRMKVRLQKNVTIPANTSMFISGKFDIKHNGKDYQGIIEPFHNLPERSNIIVTGTITYSDKNIVPIHCLNVTGTDVRLYKNQLLGFIEPMPDSDNLTDKVKKVDKTGDIYDSKIDLPRLPDACTIEQTIENGQWEDKSALIDQLKIDKMTHVPEIYREQLKDLIKEYSHCFARNRFDLGCASFYEAKLNLKNGFKPMWVPSRPIAYKIRPHLDEEIRNLESSGQISPCRYSAWNSCVFLTTKSDGSYRFVVDARAMNKQVLQDHYELPKIKNIFDKLQETKILSSLDFVSSFTQIGLEKESRHLTAFTYNGKRLMWNRMIQGQTSSSAEFSRCMALLFQKIPWKSWALYIDDLICCSNDYPTHLKRLRFIFDRLTFGNLKLSPKKTKLMQQEVKFLGHRLSEHGISVDPDKVKAIKDLPPPKSVKQVQRFLGMIGYHRSWIRGFSEISTPLYNLTHKNTKFVWSDSCQVAFEKLKHALASSPVLGIPRIDDNDNSYAVTIDASKRGLGAVLTQYCPISKKRRIISYFSKKVPQHLRNWSATRLEFLALHSAILAWKIYLKGTTFVVYTDCKSLLNMETIFSKGNDYMQRRIADLSGFKFTIKHVSGKSQEIAIPDYLSRYAFGVPEKSVEVQTDVSYFREQSVSSKKRQAYVMKNRCTDLKDKLSNLSLISDENSDSEDYFEDIKHSNYDETEPDGDSESDNDSKLISESDNDSDLTLELDNNYNISSEKQEEYDLETVLLSSEIVKDNPVTSSDIKTQYKNDKILLEVISWVKDGKRPAYINPRKCHEELHHYWCNFNLLRIKNGLLQIKRVDPNDKAKNYFATIVPYMLIERVLYMYHDTIANCHSGVDNTLDQCKRKFYFFRMKAEAKMYVSACLTCQKSKPTKKYLRANLLPQIYSHFNQNIQIDHCEPSKKRTPRGHVALLTITDMYSSFIACIPVRSTDAKTTIEKLISHWFTIYGIPEQISHDMGSGFESALFKEVAQVFGIRNVKSTPWKSSTQGRVESCHRKLNMCFRAVLSDKDFNKYDIYVKWIVFTLNCLKTSRTNYSPNYLVFHREARTPRDFFVESPCDEIGEKNYQTDAYQFYKEVRSITRKVLDTTKRRVSYMVNSYDKKVSGPFFEVGQYCMLLVTPPKHKYSFKWRGPYLILEKINDHNYIVKINGTKKIINISKMKHYPFNSRYSKIPLDQSIKKKLDTDVSKKDKINPPKKPSDNDDDDDDQDDDLDWLILSRYSTPNQSGNESTLGSRRPSISDNGTIGTSAASRRSSRSENDVIDDHPRSGGERQAITLTPTRQGDTDGQLLDETQDNFETPRQENSGTPRGVPDNEATPNPLGTDNRANPMLDDISSTPRRRTRSTSDIPRIPSIEVKRGPKKGQKRRPPPTSESSPRTLPALPVPRAGPSRNNSRQSSTVRNDRGQNSAETSNRNSESGESRQLDPSTHRSARRPGMRSQPKKTKFFGNSIRTINKYTRI